MTGGFWKTRAIDILQLPTSSRLERAPKPPQIHHRDDVDVERSQGRLSPSASPDENWHIFYPSFRCLRRVARMTNDDRNWRKQNIYHHTHPKDPYPSRSSRFDGLNIPIPTIGLVRVNPFQNGHTNGFLRVKKDLPWELWPPFFRCLRQASGGSCRWVLYCRSPGFPRWLAGNGVPTRWAPERVKKNGSGPGSNGRKWMGFPWG